MELAQAGALVQLVVRLLSPINKPHPRGPWDIEDDTMKNIATILIALCATAAWAQTYVQPYTTKDGVYVEGHYRSSPNNTDRDNYETKGNTNPYTGQAGTRTPEADRPATYGQQCGYTQAGRYVCR